MLKQFARMDRRLAVIQVCIITTLLLVPTWFRLPGVPAHTLFYSAGFLIFWPMSAAVAAWAAAGLPGLRRLWNDPLRRAWALALLALVLWALASWLWAYTRASRPAVTPGAVLPLLLTGLFALVISCSGPPSRVILSTLIAGLVWNALLAGLQTARQRSLGLSFLGEFAANPAVSGTVVVQSEGVRWLRPYGLLPHPNLLAGFLVVALLAALVWALARRGWSLGFGIAVCAGGLWALLLTFSRASWFGLMTGCGILLPFVWRFSAAHDRGWLNAARRRIVLLLVVLTAVGIAFAMLYRPFLAARAGVGSESIEMRSTSDRAVYESIAFNAIQQAPLLGVGIGNYPWIAARDLAQTTFDLEGQPVHLVMLGVWAELGLVGLLLMGTALALGIETALRALRQASAADAAARASLLAGVCAFLMIGMFDHYLWTLLPFQALWWGLLAAAGSHSDSFAASNADA